MYAEPDWTGQRESSVADSSRANLAAPDGVTFGFAGRREEDPLVLILFHFVCRPLLAITHAAGKVNQEGPQLFAPRRGRDWAGLGSALRCRPKSLILVRSYCSEQQMHMQAAGCRRGVLTLSSLDLSLPTKLPAGVA